MTHWMIIREKMLVAKTTDLQVIKLLKLLLRKKGELRKLRH